MEYVTKREHSANRARLTRAINSGNPDKVVRACEITLDSWEGKAWPDDWHRWNIALWDAAHLTLDDLNG